MGKGRPEPDVSGASSCVIRIQTLILMSDEIPSVGLYFLERAGRAIAKKARLKSIIKTRKIALTQKVSRRWLLSSLINIQG
jgi:hypothetical protein